MKYSEHFISLKAAYPVLMEMISISGFFLIFGKSSRAPPNRFPLSFFWPSSLTEWPSNEAYKYTLTWVSQLHFNLLLSTNVLMFAFNFFFYGRKKKPREDVIIEPKKNTAKEKNVVFVFIILAHFTAQMRETYILRISFHKVCSLA